MDRQSFRDNRFHKKHSSDLLMRIQFAEEKQSVTNLPQTKLEEFEDVKEEAVMTTLCSALDFYSTIQTDDGHWPGDYGGTMFLLPGLIRLNKAISDSDLFVNVEITNVFSVA
ncbi:cycloartenol synthase [Gossypium hirsutum]|uniref:Cycloartenol synthase n=1 Tax=Gossypium hirsutum TaxID=3635 RepID=A0A1U8J463_GOSHI|nr:cycloartenol synthase-like [Gossypium hirsutum]